MSTFGRILWWLALPPGIIAGKAARGIVPNQPGVGWLESFDGELLLFYEEGFSSGDLVAFDRATGAQANFAANVQSATAVPNVVRRRVTGWTYVLTSSLDADALQRINAAVAMC